MSEMCPKCGTELIFKETPNLTHYARLDCPKCNIFIKWVTSPEKINMRTKTSKHSIQQIITHYNYYEPFCFFCLRKKNELGICETLTIDHIQELDKGGKDCLENLQILCTACHKLKNWTRLYMNWHLKNGN